MTTRPCKLIVSRCTEVESGGRMIDTILTNTVLPSISREFLTRTMAGVPLNGVRLAVTNGDFDYQFEGDASADVEADLQVGLAGLKARLHERPARRGGRLQPARCATWAAGPKPRSWGPDMELPDALREVVTVDEAMSIAIQCQKHGHLAAADDIYCAILEQVPGHADALHYAGVIAHQQGRNDDAIALIEKSLALVPNQADWHSNLGIVLKARARLDEAVAAFRRAIALDPGHVNAYNNLGVLLRAQGHAAESEAAYRTAIALDPEHQDVHQNLGILLYGQRRMAEAVACFCRVITLDPKHAQALRLLAMAHCVIGEFDKAVEICERWLREEPDEPVGAPHAGRLLGAGRAAAGLRRVHRDRVRRLCRELRRQAGAADVPRAQAGCHDARGVGNRGGEDARRARCRLRHRSVWSAPHGVRGAAGWRRPVGAHARPGARARCVRRAGQRRADRVPAVLHRRRST